MKNKLEKVGKPDDHYIRDTGAAAVYWITGKRCKCYQMSKISPLEDK